jgi:hypothetical protein
MRLLAEPLTLTGLAREWFTSLPPNSINNLMNLAKHFLAQFMSTHKWKMPVTYLITVQQKDFESLKDYVERFQKERLGVTAAPRNLVLMALLNRIHPQISLVMDRAIIEPSFSELGVFKPGPHGKSHELS